MEYRYQSIERHIMGMIESGSLAPGDRLPSLRSIARDLGVSLSTATQAYAELEAKGVAESRPRSGYYVTGGVRKLPPVEDHANIMHEPRAVTRSGLISQVMDNVGWRGLIPFGLVEPNPAILPHRELARTMSNIMRDMPEKAVDYEIVPGNPGLRSRIAFRHQEKGIDVAPDEPIITVGCLEALSLALRATTRPGDTVLIQAPTYFCFLHMLETLGLRAIEIPSRPDGGIDPADLADATAKFNVSACILSPNFNNPDGATMSTEAKKEIVSILGYMDIPLIEDDVSSDLHFGSKRPGTLKQHDTRGLVILCSSFSKTLAPGFRTGWILPGRFRDKVIELKATSNVCNASPTQIAIAEYLARGKFERHLRSLREHVRRQMETMQLYLERHFPAGTRCTRPQGGMALWLHIPGVDGVDMFYRAREKGIGIAPGAIFSTQEKFHDYIRLTATGKWDESMAEAVATLGRMAHGEK